MTKEQALNVLGIRDCYDESDLKKRYRELMLLTHPDMGEEHTYPYGASEINVAYEYLLAHPGTIVNKKRKKVKEASIRWNAPINPNAYEERTIYHYVEDSLGNHIGELAIAHGRYLWIEEEEFPLFLKSLYHCSKAIIEEDDEKKGLNRSGDLLLLKEISYLMAQQYVNSDTVFELLCQSDGGDIYQTDAMVELQRYHSFLKGSSLYPSRLSDHRLYVRTEQGKEIGHLSFSDDRLYYGLIPLFERRALLVKILVKDGECRKAGRNSYLQVILQMKKTEENQEKMMESIRLKIEKLLK